MRSILLSLLLALVALSGCLGDDEPADEPTDDPMISDEPMEEPTEEDFGEYVLELATGHCHAKEYTETPTGTYQSAFAGGTWVMQETNGVPGLQLENNHPGAGTGVGFDLELDSRCADGDQVIV